MNLTKRKELAAKVLGVGKNKVRFNQDHLDEIKDAITKQDIRDLFAEGIITVKETRGRRKIVRRTTRRGPGSIKLVVRHRKRDYMIMVRKLRRHIGELRKQDKIDRVRYYELRKKIKARVFKNKAHLKDYIAGGKV